jgi:hypothetical protein
VGVAVGTVVGGTIVAASDEDDEETTTTTTTTVNNPPATASAPISILPCEPAVVESEGITYYLCGSQYYVQAYGTVGVVYMPVSGP